MLIGSIKRVAVKETNYNEEWNDGFHEGDDENEFSRIQLKLFESKVGGKDDNASDDREQSQQERQVKDD